MTAEQRARRLLPEMAEIGHPEFTTDNQRREARRALIRQGIHGHGLHRRSPEGPGVVCTEDPQDNPSRGSLTSRERQLRTFALAESAPAFGLG